MYTFANDSPGTSACDAGCAESWPPLTLVAGQEIVAGPGVDGTLGTLERADGSLQVTHDDAPLYYFAGDSAPGDTNGEGIGDVWFLAQP